MYRSKVGYTVVKTRKTGFDIQCVHLTCPIMCVLKPRNLFVCVSEDRDDGERGDGRVQAPKRHCVHVCVRSVVWRGHFVLLTEKTQIGEDLGVSICWGQATYEHILTSVTVVGSPKHMDLF
jgi:hypothetical protein